MEMEMEGTMEVDLRAENPMNAPPPHLGCESQDQNQSLKKTIAMMMMLRKKGPFSSSSSQVDGGDLGTPSPIPSPVPNTTSTTDDSDSSTVENASSSGAIATPSSSDIEFMEEVRFKRMNSLSSSSSSASSKQEVVLHPCRRRPPRSLLSSSPTSFSSIYLLDDEGRHRISKLEKIVRVLKRTHSSLRREYWTSPPTCDELRLHHLILIHVTSYITLFDIELSAPAFPPSQRQRQGDDNDPEELNDALDNEVLPAAFASFLQESRKAACPRPEDDPLLKDTWALKSMMEDDTRNGEKKEELLRILSDLEVIGRSPGYAPPLRDREIQCYREIRNLTIFSILFVNSCTLLQSDALTPGLDHFSCIPEEARLYAQIAERVYSSLWLFRCAEETQRMSSTTGTGSLKTRRHGCLGLFKP